MPPSPPHSSLDRREFLTAASAAALLAAAPASRALAEPRKPKPNRPRNLIMLVADGMSTGSLQVANIHARHTLGRNLHMYDMLADPSITTSLVNTDCANSLVTDSAAAASCWGCGHRVNNGVLCYTPEHRSPEPIFVRAKRHAGKAIGLVSTTFIQDATPAAFAVNAPKRSMYRAVVDQYVDYKIDLIVGGGGRECSDEQLAQDPSITVQRTKTAFLKAMGTPGRHAALLADWHMRYEIDRTDAEPSLAEMSRATIHHLANTREAFCIMIEGARVDHAAHGNDAAALVHDMLAFDDAVRVALDYAKDDPETLVIVTTDHANANPGIARYGSYDRYLANLASAKHSFEWVFEHFRALPTTGRTPDAFADLFQRAINAELSTVERTMLNRTLDNRPADAFEEADNTTCVMGAIAANHFGVAFNSPNHTSDPVISLALGPGADLLPRVSHLTDTHDLIQRLFDLPPVT